MRARGRRAVILAGITTGIVLVVGLLRWKDVLARYHLIRLRADPDYLRTAILEPEESAAHAGVSLYLRTEEGKDRLARVYFDECERWIASGTDFSFEKDVVQTWSYDALRFDETHRFFRSIASFLSPLRGRFFRPERHPEFQVTFLPADEAGSRTGWYFSVSEEGVFSIEHVSSGRGPEFNTVTGFLIEPVTTSP